jgi:hypothetical protein
MSKNDGDSPYIGFYFATLYKYRFSLQPSQIHGANDKLIKRAKMRQIPKAMTDILALLQNIAPVVSATILRQQMGGELCPLSCRAW